MVAGTERIKSLSYNSTLMRGGYANDISSLSIHVENLPEVLILKEVSNYPPRVYHE